MGKKKGGKKGGKKGEEKKDMNLPYYQLGKFKTSLKVGICGFPNVGKSTLFNALTSKGVAAENYAFCTKDPNIGVCKVPEERLEFLSEMYKPKQTVYASLDVVDIAGLVRGASEGKGLGNEFLSHIMSVDAIFHVVRTFKKKSIEHVEGDINPVRDIEAIQNELRLKDISMLETLAEKLVRPAKGDKAKKVELDHLYKFLDHLKEGVDIRFGKWDKKAIEILNQLQLLTAKPQIYLVNCSPKAYKDGTDALLKEVQEYVKKISGGLEKCVTFSAEFEKKYHKLKPEKREEFVKQYKCDTALPNIIKSGYDLLNLMYYFTVGPKECKCWTIKKNTPAAKAAGKIHSDFEKFFICAEIFHFDDIKKYGSETEVKNHGAVRMEGKNYIMQDGDIVLFKIGQ